MKKITALSVLALSALILFFSFYPKMIEIIVRIQRSDNPSSITVEELLQEIEHVLLATTEFDGQQIEFYYDEGMLENDGIYYTTQGKQQKITYPQNFINSEDHQYRFFADFKDEFEVYQNDVLVEPYEVLQIDYKKCKVDIPLYQLDKSKKTTLKQKGISVHYSFGCGAQSLCGHIESMQPEEVESLISTWKKSSWPDGITYNDLDYLLGFRENYYSYDFISGGFTFQIINYLTTQDNRGIFYVAKETSTHEFYELTASQWEEFQTFLKSYSSQ